MKTEKKDIVDMIKYIRANYNKAYKAQEADNILVDGWYDTLKDYEKDEVFDVIRSLVSKSTYPPKINEIVNGLKELDEEKKQRNNAEWWKKEGKSIWYGMEDVREYRKSNDTQDYKKQDDNGRWVTYCGVCNTAKEVYIDCGSKDNPNMRKVSCLCKCEAEIRDNQEKLLKKMAGVI